MAFPLIETARLMIGFSGLRHGAEGGVESGEVEILYGVAPEH
jgi:hypothetical protein